MGWQIVRVLTQLGGTAALAHILAPGDFGLLAMVTSIVGIAEIIRDFGLTTAAVQAKTLSAGQKSNLFWINIGIGLTMSIAAFLAAGPISALYGDSRLSTITQVLSGTFILSGASTQFRSELARQIRFNSLNVLDTIPPVIGLATAIAVALATQSYWALVLQQGVAAVAGLLFAIALARWKPGLPTRTASVRSLLSYGSHVMGTHSITYVARNADNVGIGYFWGPAQLGLYGRAYQLLEAPIQQITAPMTRVALPILSRVQDDWPTFSRYLSRGQRISGFVSAIIYGLAIGLAAPLVEIIFGPRWTAMTPIFQALAIGGVFRAMNQVAFWAYLALGKTREQLQFNLIAQPLVVIALFAGMPWGAFGVAVGHSVAYFLYWWASLWRCSKVTHTDLGQMIRDGLTTTALFAIPTSLLGLLATALTPAPLLSIAVGLAFAAAYVGVARVVPGPAREIVIDVIRATRMASRRAK